METQDVASVVVSLDEDSERIEDLFPRRLEAQNVVVSVVAPKAGDLDLVSVDISPLRDSDSELRLICYRLTGWESQNFVALFVSFLYGTQTQNKGDLLLSLPLPD
ncbi:hypothetical protein M9458_053674, partial [Cirrhinus mrigala]